MSHAARAAALTAAVLVPTMFAAGNAVAAPAATHHRATVVVHTTRKHGVATPRSTRPGVARLSNNGTQPIFLISSRHGAGRAALARDLNADTAGSLLRSFDVADVLPARATTYLRLTRGTYYLADASRAVFTAASIASLRVTGARVNAKAPRARAVTVRSHGTLTTPASIGTSSELGVSNHSGHLQEVFVVRVGTKTTASELNTFLARPSFEKLYTVISGVPDFLAMLSPRGHAVSSHRSSAGRYLILTLPVTSSSGEPHLGAGQVRLVTVAG